MHGQQNILKKSSGCFFKLFLSSFIQKATTPIVYTAHTQHRNNASHLIYRGPIGVMFLFW